MSELAPVRLIPAPELDAIRLRLPDPDHPVEGLLHRADRHARGQALRRLERWLPGLDLTTSSQQVDGGAPAFGTIDPAVLTALQPVDLLDRLSSHTWRPPTNFRVARDGTSRPSEDLFVTHGGPNGVTRLRPGTVAAVLEEGHTLALDGFDLRSAPSSYLAGQFERAFANLVNINAYLSTRTRTSFGAHWDDQEVVILQLVGSKDWILEQPVALSMSRVAHGDATSGNEAWSGRLQPGHSVYLPRGWGHIVNGLDELTFHYTVTMGRLNWITVLDGVITDAGADIGVPETLHGFPMVPGEPDPTWDPSTLGDLPERVAAALARHRFGFPRRSTQALTDAVAVLSGAPPNHAAVRGVNPGGWVVAHRSDGPDHETVVGTAGAFLAIADETMDQVARLTNGDLHPIEEEDLDVVQALVRAGIVDVVTDQDRAAPLSTSLSSPA